MERSIIGLISSNIHVVKGLVLEYALDPGDPVGVKTGVGSISTLKTRQYNFNPME